MSYEKPRYVTLPEDCDNDECYSHDFMLCNKNGEPIPDPVTNCYTHKKCDCCGLVQPDGDE
jgi:hypothetical protein